MTLTMLSYELYVEPRGKSKDFSFGQGLDFPYLKYAVNKKPLAVTYFPEESPPQYRPR